MRFTYRRSWGVVWDCDGRRQKQTSSDFRRTTVREASTWWMPPRSSQHRYTQSCWHTDSDMRLMLTTSHHVLRSRTCENVLSTYSAHMILSTTTKISQRYSCWLYHCRSTVSRMSVTMSSRFKYFVNAECRPPTKVPRWRFVFRVSDLYFRRYRQ